MVRTSWLVVAVIVAACGGRARAPEQPSPWGRGETYAGDRPEVSGPVDLAVVNRPGQEIELASVLVAGKITVVDFYADWCAPCKRVEKKLVAAMADLPNVALRKINVAEMDSPVAIQHNIRGIPHLKVFDARGRPRFVLVGPDAQRVADVVRLLAEER